MKKIICIAFLLFNCSNAISDNKKTHGLGVPLTSNEMNAISKIKEMVLEFIRYYHITILILQFFTRILLQKKYWKVLSCQMTCILPFQKMDV